MSNQPERRAPVISVVVPSYQGAAHLASCLAALARQTLPDTDLELVVVLNGPSDGSRLLIDTARSAHPRLSIRVVETAAPSAGGARNLGLHAATGHYVTFVDADDEVTPTYLSGLLAHAERGVVPVALVAEVRAAGSPPSFDNYLAKRFGRVAGHVVDATEVPSALGFVAGKLIPTAIARLARFDTALRSGEDLLYWFDLHNAAPFQIRTAAPEEDCVYLRHVVPGSVSRQDHSYDFAVSQRLDVIERLWSRIVEDPRSLRLRRSLIAAQTSFINAFLRHDPDAHARVVANVRERGLTDAIPWRRLNRGVARDLGVLYSFLPYADTSALVAARRIRERGVPLDVVSNVMTEDKSIDPSGRVVAREYLDTTLRIDSPPAAFRWGPLRSFVRKSLATVTDWEQEKGPYRSVYSRTMWPGSHLVAAMLKLRRPEIRWIAEFSDPQLFNAYGQRRVGDAVNDALWRTLASGLEAAGVPAPADRNIPHLVELLAYALADEIVFTNEHQRTFMLDYLPEQDLVPRILERSTVEHHPTLPPDFYTRGTVEYSLPEGVLNIAYFGAFYATRGLTEVIEALRSLDPAERARVRFHVFTADPATLAREAAGQGLDDVLIANPYVGYLDFLALTARMDVLLVNDAHTRQHYTINPFLPSKWSDYAGSGSAVWALVEPGSVLSGMSTAYRSELGDPAAATAQIRRMLADRGITD